MKLLRNTCSFLAALLLAPVAVFTCPTQIAQAQIAVIADSAPPALPVTDQPPCPGDGYIWTPGYWAYSPNGYRWQTGAWVTPPYVGGLWTPGYWGLNGGLYNWFPGYWGMTVGYYGGLNYGFGYFGSGFYGGYWSGGRFRYNRAYGNYGRGFGGDFYGRNYASAALRSSGSSFARIGNQAAIGRRSSFGSSYGAGNRGSNVASISNAFSGTHSTVAPSYGGRAFGDSSYAGRSSSGGMSSNYAGSAHSYSGGMSRGGGGGRR